MILFPHAKINLGLDILRRRPDGYHDLSTVMIPVGWSDVLEIVPAQGERPTLTVTGRTVACAPDDNLVMKAWKAVSQAVGGGLPPVDMFLHKIIPDGAGLGGGSADAAFAIRGINELFALGLEAGSMADIAASVGADCPFFIYDEPMLATGTGTVLNPVSLPVLDTLYIAIAKPMSRSVSTREAYAGVVTAVPSVTLADRLTLPVSRWRGTVTNAFEATVGALVPQIEQLKEHFYSHGAIYASMSGSGSAVYGLFGSDKLAEASLRTLAGCDTYHGALSQRCER